MVLRLDGKPKSKNWSSFLRVFLSLTFILVLVGLQLSTSVSSLNAITTISSNVLDSFFLSPSIRTPVDEEPPYNDELGPLNIVIFYPDDWRYDAIGDAHPGVIHTPFLTHLAKDGIRFTHNAVTTSICWISRATLFTGRYSSQHKSERLYCPVFTLPSNWNSSWPFLLQKKANYFVGHVGKWQFHNKMTSSLFNWTSFHEGHHWYNVNRKRIHAADRARDDALRFLKQRPKANNFALTVAFYPPKPLALTPEPGSQWEPDDAHKALYANQTFHQPYNYTEAWSYIPPFLKRGHTQIRWETRWKTDPQYQASMRNYYALVSHVDDSCRDIVAEIDRQGILNRTLIIVSADNGLFLGAHGLGGKWHPYHESIRVPLIIYDPRMAKTKRGTTDDALTLNIDLAPTILGAAQLDKDPRMQGRDLADLYVKRKKADSNKSMYGIEEEPWRHDFYYEFPLIEFPASTALVTRHYKYIRWANELEHVFDMQNDPYELDDLLSPSSPTELLIEANGGKLPNNNSNNNGIVNNGKYSRPSPEEIERIRRELQERHRELERQVKEPFPGEEQIDCIRGGSEWP